VHGLDREGEKSGGLILKQKGNAGEKGGSHLVSNGKWYQGGACAHGEYDGRMGTRRVWRGETKRGSARAVAAG